MTDSDAYREAFGPGLLGKYIHHPDIAFEKDADGTPTPILKAGFQYPDDEGDEDQTSDARAYKAGRDDGARAVLEFIRTWLGAAGMSGLKGQSVALAHALKSFPDVTRTELSERAGILKQTAALGEDRLEAVLPLLRLPSACDPEQIKNQQRAMRDSWRRRKKEGPPTKEGFEATDENLGGSQ
jgi:hypothetical protein